MKSAGCYKKAKKICEVFSVDYICDVPRENEEANDE